MELKDCKTPGERGVIHTYRRLMKRKGAHWFGMVSVAIQEESRYGARLSPEFVHRFTRGTRRMDETGRVTMTHLGRSIMADINRGCTEPMPVAIHHAHDGYETACGAAFTEQVGDLDGDLDGSAMAGCIACHAVLPTVKTEVK